LGILVSLYVCPSPPSPCVFVALYFLSFSLDFSFLLLYQKNLSRTASRLFPLRDRLALRTHPCALFFFFYFFPLLGCFAAPAPVLRAGKGQVDQMAMEGDAGFMCAPFSSFFVFCFLFLPPFPRLSWTRTAACSPVQRLRQVL
jgi:hypothetical protein